MRYRRLLTLPVAGLLIAAPAAPLAVAQSVTDQVVHRQSVLTEVDATGLTGVSRIFTQLAVPAGRTVTLPGQSTSGLRSLSGGAPTVDAGTFVFGSGLARTVADNTADLPVSIEIQYAIDGRPVSPDRVIGHDGEVAVTYIVRNLTAVPTELTLVDGDGSTSTQNVDVAVPMVGSLSLTLPSAFRDVVAPGAVVVGDGRGGTVVNWSLLLFSPLGSETQEVTWTAQARDAVVPAASMQVIPVTPDSFGSLGATEQAYAGAVEATTGLTDGARQIDTNLQRLADGAGELLAGLLQLRDGAQELAVGLGAASTGAGELSSGLVRARAGANELGTGLGDLSAGSSTIADALAAADAGGRDLSAGLGRLSAGSGELADGLGDLSAGAMLVDANTALLAAGAGSLSTGAMQVLAGIQLLSTNLQGPEGLPYALAGIDLLQAGIGAVGTSDTLLDGLALLDGGLVQVQNGIGSPAVPGTLRNGLALVGGGLDNPACDPLEPPDPANPCGITQFNGVVSTLSGEILTDLQAVLVALGDIDISSLDPVDQLAYTTALSTLATNATRAGTIQGMSGGITAVVVALKSGLAAVDAGLVATADAIGNPAAADTLRNGVFRITAGVSNPLCDPANPTDPANPCGLLEGLTALETGLTDAAVELEAGLGDTSTEGTLLWGADQVATGSEQLATGATQLQSEGTAALAAGAEAARDGAEQVADGAAEAAAGSTQLSDGLGQIVDGAEQLDAGALRAATGGADLADGLGLLDDGARQLAAGLEDAADGSQRLADGQVDAYDGGQQIADGAQQLVDEGTSVLADSVSEATVSSSLQLEQVRAVAARGVAGDGLPYPTVDGAVASAVYQFDLAGVGSTDGAGLPGRLGIGLVALAVAMALGALVRARPQGARITEGQPEMIDL